MEPASHLMEKDKEKTRIPGLCEACAWPPIAAPWAWCVHPGVARKRVHAGSHGGKAQALSWESEGGYLGACFPPFSGILWVSHLCTPRGMAVRGDCSILVQ